MRSWFWRKWPRLGSWWIQPARAFDKSSTSWWKLIASLKKLRKAGMKTTTSLTVTVSFEGFLQGEKMEILLRQATEVLKSEHRQVNVVTWMILGLFWLCHMPCCVIPTVIPPNHLYKSLIQSALQDIYASTSQSDILATNAFWYILEEKSLETSKYRSFQWVERSAKFGCHFNHFISAMVKHIP